MLESLKLQEIAQAISSRFEEVDAAREKGLVFARKVIKSCSLAIRAVHRREFEEADASLAQAKELLEKCNQTLSAHPEVYYSGFVQDAEKEYAEAKITYAIVVGNPIPGPEQLGVDHAPYLNGMAEAVGELRRHILDQLRRGDSERGERILEVMDDIYYLLISMDFPDAVTRGLRRSTDVARSCLERTRGDLTNHMAGLNLEKGLDFLRARLAGRDPEPVRN